MMEFFRKLVLSGVLVFVQPGTSAQILVATMVSVMFLGFVSYYKPYADDGDDTVGFISFICLVYTLVLGLSLVSYIACELFLFCFTDHNLIPSFFFPKQILASGGD